MKKVGVSREEKELSYYRFFEQDLAQIPKEKIQILEAGAAKVKAVPFDEKICIWKEKMKNIVRPDMGSWRTEPDSYAILHTCLM